MSTKLSESPPIESLIACPVTGTPVPRELIEVQAYYKWARRCHTAGKAVHGRDKLDWLEAEKELSAMWYSMTVLDMLLFAKSLTCEQFQVSREAIRERAYYKAMQKSADDHSSSECEQIWHEAEAEERRMIFAEAFLSFCTRRRQITVFDPNR